VPSQLKLFPPEVIERQTTPTFQRYQNINLPVKKRAPEWHEGLYQDRNFVEKKTVTPRQQTEIMTFCDMSNQIPVKSVLKQRLEKSPMNPIDEETTQSPSF
jgi:hypothetical protein